MDKPNESSLTPKPNEGWPVQIETWPGEVKTISGGTRCAINLNRPWQPEIIVPDNPNCALCSKLLPEQILAVDSSPKAGDWLRVQNWYTPYDPEREGLHQMAIPEICIPTSKLCELGGIHKIGLALQMALRAMEWETISMSTITIWTVGVHIGQLAGQNISHLHWHIVMADSNPQYPYYMDERCKWASHCTENRTVIKHPHWTVFAGGNRAGQCILVPDECQLSNNLRMLQLADAIDALVRLGNDKFRSKQGFTPNFSLALSFAAIKYCTNKNSIVIIHGLYTPILNNWGGTEALAPFTRQPYTLAWPHDLTAAYLRSEVEV